MTAPTLPPLGHTPDEGRNRALIVVAGVVAVVAVIVIIVALTRDDKPATVTAGTVGPTAAGGNLPPPAAATADPTAVISGGVTVTSAAPTGLQVVSVSAPEVWLCASTPSSETPPTLTLLWTTSGAESVTVAIDDPSALYQVGLPANGSLDVPAPCAPDTKTYYVTAVGADGVTETKSVQTKGT